MPTLADMLIALKAQINESMAPNVANDSRLKTLLSEQQRWLASQFDWSFLHTNVDVNIPSGTRYFDLTTLPVTLDLTRPIGDDFLWVKWTTTWMRVALGIGPCEMNIIDSDQGQTQDPIQRWRRSGGTMIEFWPVPATDTIIRFYGQRQLDPMTGDGDTPDLDDQVIVLYTAAEFLARHKLPDSQAKLQKAQARLQTVRANEPSETVVLGGSFPTDRETKFVGAKIAVVGPAH